MVRGRESIVCAVARQLVLLLSAMVPALLLQNIAQIFSVRWPL